MAAVNVLTVTYFLAIENYPTLHVIFPTFLHYILIAVFIGVPLLVLVGYAHYKRSAAYSAEADINVEAYPYWYKLPPGWNKEVVFPLYLSMLNIMIKMSKNEKLSPDEIDKITNIICINILEAFSRKFPLYSSSDSRSLLQKKN